MPEGGADDKDGVAQANGLFQGPTTFRVKSERRGRMVLIEGKRQGVRQTLDRTLWGNIR